ncbi:hypothetical protein GGR50DRAFT_692982 [Xylaria sp. CBS 124048]|nr:hypothetical protein GGR50DRAFT_692982 [Xylaria sp. CBS 124048]
MPSMRSTILATALLGSVIQYAAAAPGSAVHGIERRDETHAVVVDEATPASKPVVTVAPKKAEDGSKDSGAASATSIFMTFDLGPPLTFPADPTTSATPVVLTTVSAPPAKQTISSASSGNADSDNEANANDGSSDSDDNNESNADAGSSDSGDDHASNAFNGETTTSLDSATHGSVITVTAPTETTSTTAMATATATAITTATTPATTAAATASSGSSSGSSSASSSASASVPASVSASVSASASPSASHTSDKLGDASLNGKASMFGVVAAMAVTLALGF